MKPWPVVFISQYPHSMETLGRIPRVGWHGSTTAIAHNFNENKKRQTMPFYLKDHALAWYNAQSPETKGDLALLTNALENRFNGSDGLDNDMGLYNGTLMGEKLKF